jgi:DhnA family fructose-bisphosphate aldolase class Ia
LLDQGVAGIVYGRNVIQHANPRGITRALMAMVHENIGVEEAMQHLVP